MENYEMLDRIGEGTFGEVHRVMKITSGEVFALKLVRIRNLEDGVPNSALREIRALRELYHPHVCVNLCFFLSQIGSQVAFYRSTSTLPGVVCSNSYLFLALSSWALDCSSI